MLILPSFSMVCSPPPSHVSTASLGALAGHEHCLLTISPSPLLPLYLAASSHLLTQLPKVISEYGISCLWSAAPLCQVKFLTLIYCDCPHLVTVFPTTLIFKTCMVSWLFLFFSPKHEGLFLIMPGFMLFHLLLYLSSVGIRFWRPHNSYSLHVLRRSEDNVVVMVVIINTYCNFRLTLW